jgi:outer membrane receptor protein involved in Fe transport
MKFIALRLSATASTIALTAAFATPAFGQTPAPATPPAPDCSLPANAALPACASEQAVESGTTPSSAEAITVTGTRIRRPNLESPLPVTSVGGQEFFQTGNVSVGDKLAELPAIRSTFTQSNSTRFLGTSGLNILDLRGLGTARTLVLVNGRRHVGGDVLSTGVGVDTNTMPTDLIDRVDVVTGGNSAVYGSDAIAGVVNFILKDNYDGIQLRGQGGVSKYGDYGSYFISGLAGKNFFDGRANIALNVEYARQDDAFGDARPWLRDQAGFLAVDADTAAGPDGIPDNLFFRDIRSASLSPTGTVRFGGTILAGPGAGGVSGLNCGPSDFGTGSSAFYNCPFNFTPTGQLVPITGTRVGLGPTGSFFGGNGYARQAGKLLQLTPQLDRYNVNLLGHFEITPAIVPFIEAKFSRTDSVGTGSSGPSFMTGSAMADPLQFFFASGGTGSGRTSQTNPGNREGIALNNPFLDLTTSQFIANQILASGVNPCTFSTLSQTDLNRIAAGTFHFCLRENLEGLGSRVEEARRDTYRVVGGLKGDFNDDWHYEASLNYGHLKEKTKIKGNLDIQRFLLANDAVRDPNTGQIVCASQIDPSRAFGYYPWFYYQYYGADYPGADPNATARLANDIAQCTPINPLGGQFTDAQRAYLLRDTIAKGTTTQFDATAFISGDTSSFLNLWSGEPIGFVLGAEYRTDNVTYDLDRDTQLGYTFYNAIPSFRAPKSKVKEAFGEISIPFIKDKPGIRELEFDAAARVSDYNLGTTGTVWAYNFNGIYSPFNGLRFRGNYARAVRAPNQVELFSPLGQNFAPGFTDPCSAININSGSQFRAANCAAAGRPAGYDFRYSSSLSFQSGGNVNLEAEKSDSWTLGGVFTPTFIPGFSTSVDYYDITVNNSIAFVGAQAVANACYDVPTFPNVFCGQFQRAGAGGGPHGEQEFQIIEGSLISAPLNYAKLTARGIDTEIAYRHNFSGIGRLDTRFTYTHVIDRSNFISATDPTFKDVQLLELGDPQDAFNWNTSLTHGRFTLGYQMRYVGKMVLNLYEDFFPVQDRPPQNPDFADRKFYPSKFYHDVRLGVDIGPKYNFYMGVDNLTNTVPPFGLTGIGGGSAIYDNRGRFFYAGARANF